MGKRGGENSQLSKEEYEALENQEVVAGSYKKASAEVLSGRRIIRASSKFKQAKSSSDSGSKSNAFANFSFGGGFAKAPAPALPAGKPSFAMPTLPTYNAPAASTTTAPKFSFTSQSKSAPMSSSTSSTSTRTSGNTEVAKLMAGMKAYVQKADPRVVLDLPMTRFIHTYRELTKNEAKTKSSGSSSASTGTTSKPLFPSVAAPAPAPPASKPLFPSAPAPAPPSDSGSKPLFPPVSGPAPVPFSFDTSAAPAPTFNFSSSNPSAPAPAPTKFSFTGAPAPAPAPSEGAEDGEVQENEPSVLSEADDDWNTVHKTKVYAYHYRKESQPTKFAGGELKLQKHKENPENRIMVMRDVTGKITLNLQISKSMTFQKKINKGKPGQQDFCRIIFYAVQDAERGAEMFCLRCRKEDLDSLHSKLEEMAK